MIRNHAKAPETEKPAPAAAPGAWPLIDAHAHLDGYGQRGAVSLEAALEEIRRHRIFTIGNSMDLPSYERNLEIADLCPYVLPIFGIHPWNAHRYADRLDDLRPALGRSPVIGEIGLDRFFVHDESRYTAQRRVFEFFLDAARAEDKIVIVHVKGAEEEAFEALAARAPRRVVIHWYSGPWEVFRKMADRGFYFTVNLEAAHSEKIARVAREIPADRLLTETDNPGGPRRYLHRPGTPAILFDIIRSLAAARQIEPDDLVSSVWANIKALFGDDTRLAEFLAKISNS